MQNFPRVCWGPLKLFTTIKKIISGCVLPYFTLFIIALNYLDITSVKIYSDQNDDRYYFGENAIIRAHIENLSAVKVMTWHWKKDGRSTCIDTTKEKFLGTSCNPIDEPKLIINNCCESDVGIYYLLVACKDVEICSNEIKLKVVKG